MIKDVDELIIHLNGDLLAEKLEASLNSKKSGLSMVPKIQNPQLPPKPKIPKVKNLKLIKIKPIEVARQICLFDYECFSDIKPIEFLNQAWNNPKLKHRAVNILKMIHRFNHLSKFISYNILSEPNMKKRTKLISKVIDIAWNLFEMQNFSSAVSIISGLDNAAVYRLKFSKQKVKPSLLEKYEDLRRFINPQESYKAYRALLSKAVPPCIPHIGILLTDLVFIEDGNPDLIDSNLINFHKKRLAINNIMQFNLHQKSPYNFQKVDIIQDYLDKEMEDLENITDQDLFQISLKIEPRGWDGVSEIT
jgi:hypothetical protein